jgi:hypothetical protein
MFRCSKPKYILPILLALFCGLSSYAYAQEGDPAIAPYVAVGVDCHDEEHTKALLDFAAISAGTDKTIILIARLGTGERSRNLTRLRLRIAGGYLMENRGVPKDRVITAEGERVRGLGHVEVYVGGRLHTLFKMKRSRGFGGCGLGG